MAVGYYPNQSGQILAQGIMGAAGSIAESITRHKAETKRLNAFRAMAVDGLGMPAEEVDKLDADTLQGKMQAMAVKAELEKLKRDQEDAAYTAAQRLAAGEFQKRLAPLPNGAQGPEAPLDARRMLAAAADSGFQLDPRTIAQFAKEEQGVNWEDVTPRPFEIEGVKGAVGKSGQFQFLPQATPESLQAVPVLDDAGNIVGMRVPTGKGGTASLPQRNPKTLPDGYNTRLALLQDELRAAETNAGKTDEELKAMKLPGRSHYASRAETARKALRDHVARYKGQGYADESFWTEEESRLGLGTKASAVAGNYPTAKNPKTGETMIFKDGKWQKP